MIDPNRAEDSNILSVARDLSLPQSQTSSNISLEISPSSPPPSVVAEKMGDVFDFEFLKNICLLILLTGFYDFLKF